MFTIPVNVTSEVGLYEPYDPAGISLSAGVRGYLESFVEDREVGQEVRLELVCATPINLGRFDGAYRAYIDVLHAGARRNGRRNSPMRRACWASESYSSWRACC